jgi:hypothetical protein
LITHSSHLNDHLNDSVPVCLSSTMLVGLYSSRILTLVDADGAVAVIKSDSDNGSIQELAFRVAAHLDQ